MHVIQERQTLKYQTCQFRIVGLTDFLTTSSLSVFFLGDRCRVVQGLPLNQIKTRYVFDLTERAR
jgi:hypothetical protein